MLTSLLVLDMVLELDLRLPSQSREIERLLCLCFFDTGGLGGRGVLTRLASGESLRGRDDLRYGLSEV